MAAAGSRAGPYAIVTADDGIAGLLSDTDYARALTFQRGFQSSLTG
jgi:hypothetical protein